MEWVRPTNSILAGAEAQPCPREHFPLLDRFPLKFCSTKVSHHA
jgi:hypothetical protein